METLKRIVVENIRLEILAVIWGLYLWELYLTLRQRKLIQSLQVPPSSLDGLIPLDVYQKARNYSLDKNRLCIMSNFFSTLLSTLFVFAYPYFWLWGSTAVEFFGIAKNSELMNSAGCIVLMNVVTEVADLPFKIHETFVVEEKYGFNKQTPSFFAQDQAKKFVVKHMTAWLVVSNLIQPEDNGQFKPINSDDKFWITIGIISIIIKLFTSILYPGLIAPLFDKFTPLPDGELKRKIEALAASVDFPSHKLYILEGSKRSAHSNAYVHGFFKHKRIVIYDTLVKGFCKSEDGDGKENRGCENDEIVGILAHELGHWKYNHPLKIFWLGQFRFVMNLLPLPWLLDCKAMYVAFGFTDSQPVLIGLIIVMKYILRPLNTLMGFFSTVNSRRFEFQADQFAKKLGHGESAKRALVKMHKDNLDYPFFDPLYSSWFLEHPPLLERLAAFGKVE